MDDAAHTRSSSLRESLLQSMIDISASDLHLAPEQRPMFRVDGALAHIDPFRERFSTQQVQALAEEIRGGAFKEAEISSGSIDGAMTSGAGGRFRYNIYKRFPGIAIAIRQLASEFRTLDELGLPDSIGEWAHLVDGLVIVSGPTGSGKSTTLATLIDRINRERAAHIITLEDPIEYLHNSLRSRVDQRQIGVHAPDFNSALVSSLRQDPDVILVGEIREKETIRTAIVAAETGHLVFATVHASDASGAIQRLTSVFPIDEQPGILRQLSMNLRAVLSQHLVPADGVAAMSQNRKEKRKRILLSEILQMTPATSNLVAKGQFQNLRSFMETGSKFGMQTLEENLFGWIQSGHLSKASALSFTRNKKVLEQRINRGRDAVQKNRNHKPR